MDQPILCFDFLLLIVLITMYAQVVVLILVVEFIHLFALTVMVLFLILHAEFGINIFVITALANMNLVFATILQLLTLLSRFVFVILQNIVGVSVALVARIHVHVLAAISFVNVYLLNVEALNHVAIVPVFVIQTKTVIKHFFVIGHGVHVQEQVH